MNKFKKIIDIIIIGIAIVVVVILGDKIIKIGSDVREGKYPGYEQEDDSGIIGDEETTLDSNNTMAAINLNMEIDQSLFQERKDFLAAVPKEEIKEITKASDGVSGEPREAPGEVLENEKGKNEPE